MMSKVGRVLKYYNSRNIKRYRDEKVIGLLEAKQAIALLCIEEAYKHAKSLEDLKDIMYFQFKYRRLLL